MPFTAKYPQVEDAILDDGGRLLAVGGKLDRRGLGFEAAFYVLRGGRGVILQKMGRGDRGETSVEVYAPITSDLTIAGTIAALWRYRDVGPAKHADTGPSDLAPVGA